MESYPVIPLTPRKQTISNLGRDASAIFPAVIWIEIPSDSRVEDYLVEYDHWTTYDENTTYSKRKYQAAYTGRIRDYHNCLCVAQTQNGEELYVVAKRVRTELEELEQYCPCTTCSAWILNPLKYLWCPVCTGCVKSGTGYAREEHVKLARMIASGQPVKYRLETYWRQPIHQCQAAFLAILAMILLLS
jgi:hypothetical protein